jgi:hypothetical protein
MSSPQQLTPRKRVPLKVDEPHPVDEAFLSEGTRSELEQIVRREATTFKTSGGTKLVHHTQPEVISDSTQPETAAPAEIKNNRLFFLGLRKLFNQLGACGCDPATCHGLRTMMEAVNSVATPALTWQVETELQRRIRERQEALNEHHSGLKKRAQELSAEQRQLFEVPQNEPGLTPKQKADMGAAEDDLKIRRIENEAREKELAEERRRLIESERTRARLAEAKAQREARSAQRQQRLEELLDQEDEARDYQDAAVRLRSKFENEKQKGLPSES